MHSSQGRNWRWGGGLILNSTKFFPLCTSLWVSRVLKYPKKCFEDLTTFFMSIWWGGSKNLEEIEFSSWLFEGRLRQGKSVLPDGLNWLCYFAANSKSHRENSISFMFLESPHQVDMKNIVKSSKHFFRYFNTLETHSVSILEIAF